MSLGVVLAMACSGGGGHDQLDPTGRTQAAIGPEGGTVEVTDPGQLLGVKVTVPAGAVDQKTTFSIEYGTSMPAALPRGLSADHPLVQFGPAASFAKPLEITFPVTYLPTGDGHILGAYCWSPTKARWMVHPARRLDGASKLVVATNQLALCRWGTIRLGEVDDATAKAWMDDLQGMVDDWDQLEAGLLARLQPFVAIVEDPQRLARCATQDDVLKMLATWRADALAGLTAHVATLQQTCRICDQGNTNCLPSVCDPEMLISGQPLSWLMDEVRIWYESVFISSFCPSDILSPIVEKVVAWSMYQEAIRELRCDWRCVVRHGDAGFWVDLLVGNATSFSIFGIEWWRSHQGCI